MLCDPVAVIAGIILVLCIMLSAWLCLVLLMMAARLFPPRLSRLRSLLLLGRATPQDIGFTYEELRLSVHPVGLPPVILSTWLVRNPSSGGRTVILIHGYADAISGAAAWIPLLHQANCNVLLIDLPGHGESSRAPCTAGARERHYISAVIDELKRRYSDDFRQIILYGLSMGGAVALATAQIRNHIAAVILDSPYSDYRRACVRHAKLFGLPGALFQLPGARLAEWMLRINLDDVSPMLLIPKTPCPILLIHADEDQLISKEDAQVMMEMIRTKGSQDRLSQSLTIPAGHLLAVSADPELYTKTLQDFLKRLPDSQ